MIKLNFPSYSFSIKEENGTQLIFDEQRKKYVVLTPEEWVRQHLVKYLIHEKKYPSSLIAVETSLEVCHQSLRADVVVYHPDRFPLLIAECKAPTQPINQKVFDQIAVYNLTLNVRFLVLTNGLLHYCCRVDSDSKKCVFLNSIPDYFTAGGR